MQRMAYVLKESLFAALSRKWNTVVRSHLKRVFTHCKLIFIPYLPVGVNGSLDGRNQSENLNWSWKWSHSAAILNPTDMKWRHCVRLSPFKGAPRSFGEQNFNQKRKIPYWLIFLCPNKQNKQTKCLLFSWLNKQTDLKRHHSFTVYMWRTLPPF